MMDYSRPYKHTSMWEIVPENLVLAMKRANVSQNQLAQAVGMKQPSIGRLISGATKTTRAVDRMAAYLNTTVAFLKGEADGPDIPEGTPPPVVLSMAAPDTVQITEFELAYGLGASFIHGDDIHSRVRTFTRGWLRYFTDAPFDQLMFARGIGDR
jgi:transcriptional regulator with XRE-family HTH domain